MSCVLSLALTDPDQHLEYASRLCNIWQICAALYFSHFIVFVTLSIVFRYVMIKYADRGLVENGSVSPLFGKLYLVVCVTLFSVFFLFASYYYLHRDPNKKSNFHLMCMKTSVDSDFESMKSIILFLSLSASFYI